MTDFETFAKQRSMEASGKSVKADDINIIKLSEIIDKNEEAEVRNVFSYFQNALRISCMYETLFDFCETASHCLTMNN